VSVFPADILLATDGSPDAALAARAATDLSSATRAKLHVVHVGRSLSAYALPADMPKEDYPFLFARDAEVLREEQTASIEHAGGAIAEAHLRFGRPADGILEVAEESGAEMIVMGSRGVGPLERLVMGSVSEEVVHHAGLPVLFMRGKERAWPPASVVLGDDASPEARQAAELAASIGSLHPGGSSGGGAGPHRRG
jgi:nucleotide-binding universal stress UspA family protein